jgi:paraquat-inducible protein A
VICPKCNTLYRKLDLPAGKRAVCKHCGTILYRNDPRYLDRALALSITGGILFVVANLFPLIRIDLLGAEKTMNIIEVLSQLIASGYYIVAIGVLFLVLIIPAMVMIDYVLLLVLMRNRKSKALTRDLLVLLSHLMPWSMVDIFLVSILVALVKLTGDVQIHFGISFWALLLYVGIDIYLTKARRIGYLWALRSRIYRHA